METAHVKYKVHLKARIQRRTRDYRQSNGLTVMARLNSKSKQARFFKKHTVVSGEV